MAIDREPKSYWGGGNTGRGKWEARGVTGDMNDAIEGLEVSREEAIITLGEQEQFSETLDGVWWVVGERRGQLVTDLGL